MSRSRWFAFVACLVGVAACGSVDGGTPDAEAGGAGGTTVPSITDTTMLYADLRASAADILPPARALEVQLDSEGRLAQLGIEPVIEAPQQFADYAARYVARNAELLANAKFEPV